jgi:hypothetical protein
MYTYPSDKPGMKYLFPCEQPDEREARNKEERQKLQQKAAGTIPPPPTVAPTR